MKTILSLLIATLLSIAAEAGTVNGTIRNQKGEPLSGVSISLLYPEDSTLATFGITDKSGIFQVNNVKNGSYVLQAASTGYYTEYQKLTVNGAAVDMGTMILLVNAATTNLGEVTVSGEKVPIKIKGDTVEYNAGSFKVKPNAPVEDLLKQLPGVQVDANGNIKSMGKDVNKVLVDGKEFFGNDPKVATKNLPADAVSRVQTFGKKSDQTEFTGIDDGERDQTINLILKDGKRAGYFGDVNAGVGTEGRYEAGLKAFKFKPKTQMAAIGTLNNINKFGFSFSDYMNFNGGLAGMMGSGGGSFSMEADDDEPVDFGQPITGNITSGALGLNYSYEHRKGNRFNVSYLGSGTRKQLTTNTRSQNFLPGGNNYKTEADDESNTNGIAHRLSAKWRNEFDSLNQFNISAKAQLKNNDANSRSQSQSFTEAALQNRLDDNTSARGMSADFSGEAGFVHKGRGKWRVMQARGQFGYSQSINKQVWQNTTRFFGSGTDVYNSQFQDDDNSKLTSALLLSATRSLGKGLYLDPKIKGGYNRESLNRDQGLYPANNGNIDSLSPNFYNDIYTLLPGITLKKSTTQTQWNIGVQAELLNMNPVTKGKREHSSTYQYLLPSLYWRRDLGGHKSLDFNYNTSVNTPATNQLLPVTYYSNPLSGITGNLGLRPEYQHQGGISYHHFDAFNMASLFTYINANYTTNKINTARFVDNELRQQVLWVNTPYEGRISFRASYGRPVKKLGIDLGGDLTETVSMSVTPINGVENKTTSYTHNLSINANNRKNTVWNIRGEASVQITDAYYSVNSEQNNTFFNYTGTGSIGFQSKDNKWFAQVSADVTHYTARSFDQPITIPLLKAEVSRFIFPNQRGTITLRGFDLLDKNKSVVRSSQMNFLTERRTNIIGRYFMLSFNYKLSKTGKKNAPGMIEIQ